MNNCIVDFFKRHPALASEIRAYDVSCRFDYDGNCLPFSSLSVMTEHLSFLKSIFVLVDKHILNYDDAMLVISKIIDNYYK